MDNREMMMKPGETFLNLRKKKGEEQGPENPYATAYKEDFLQQAQQMEDSKFTLLGVQYGDSQSMKAVKSSLETLNTKMLSTPIASDAGQLQEQKEYFLNLFVQLQNACREYISSHKWPITPSGRTRKRLVEGTLQMAMKERAAILNGDPERLARRMRDVADESQKGTWANVLGASRQHVFDASDTEKWERSMTGGALSEVHVFQKKDGEKTHKKKFFKKNERHLTAAEKLGERYIREDLSEEDTKARRKSELVQRLLAYERIAAERGVKSLMSSVGGTEDTPTSFFKEQAARHFARTGVGKENPLSDILSNEEDLEIFKELCVEGGSYVAPEQTYSMYGIRLGSMISTRNVATSRMAALFGTNMTKVIPQSTTAVMQENGKSYEGIVMKQADGISLPDLRDMAKEKKKSVRYSPQAARQAMWLHLFDIVCGQMDRNTGNRFVTWREEGDSIVITGIQGIDNDVSFGILDAKQTVVRGMGNLTGSRQVPVVMDEELYTTIQQMAGQSELIRHTLEDILAPDEIESLLTRIQVLKEYLEAAYGDQSRIIREDQWDDQTVERLNAQRAPFLM